MTQVSKVRSESLMRGAKRTIKIANVTAADFVQYNRDHAKLKDINSKYGAFNQISIFNRDVVDVELELDFCDAKAYPVPAASSLSLDEVIYQGFNLKNLDNSTAVTSDQITVICGFESPLVRERHLNSKKLGGVI